MPLVERYINDITNFYTLLRFNVKVIFSYCFERHYNFTDLLDIALAIFFVNE